MEDRSLLDKANQLREQHGWVVYVDLAEKELRLLNEDSLSEYTTITLEEELAEDAAFSTGRQEAELTDQSLKDFCSKELYGGDLELSEIAMLLFCEELAKDYQLGGFYVKDDRYYRGSENWRTYNEVQFYVSSLIQEAEQKLAFESKDLSKMRLANELRKNYGMIAYAVGQDDREVVIAKVVDKEVDSVIVEKVPDEKDLPKFLLNQKGSLTTLNYMDTFSPLFEDCFPDGEVTEHNLLQFCDKVSNYLHLGLIYLDGNVIKVLGRSFTNKDELLTSLPGLIKEELEKEIQGALKHLSELASDYEYTQDGNAIILDGIAYVADSLSTLSKKTGLFYIEGYLQHGNIVWSKVDKSKFTPIQAETEGSQSKEETKEIYLLETLYYSDLYIVYRSIVKGEEDKVVRSPYPVAILEDGEYAFYFETKSDQHIEEKPKWYNRLFKTDREIG